MRSRNDLLFLSGVFSIFAVVAFAHVWVTTVIESPILSNVCKHYVWKLCMVLKSDNFKYFKFEIVLLKFIFWDIWCHTGYPTESTGFHAWKMDSDFQFGLLRGKVRVKKNPPRSGVLSQNSTFVIILKLTINFQGNFRKKFKMVERQWHHQLLSVEKKMSHRKFCWCSIRMRRK